MADNMEVRTSLLDRGSQEAALTALRMICENDQGESWSAGVAMSALASIEERRNDGRCRFTSAAGVRCTLHAGHAGGHHAYPAEWDDNAAR